jgi:hypothetical protein
MSGPKPEPTICPRCGSTQIKLCGESVEYGPEEHPGQPLDQRALRTLAYQCQCGLAFTRTIKTGEAT